MLSVMKVDRATIVPMESPTGSLRQLPAPLTAKQCQEPELDRGEDPVRYEIDGEGQCHEPRELLPDWMNTKPKLMRIIGQGICEINPMVAGAGVQEGLTSPLDQISQSIDFPN